MSKYCGDASQASLLANTHANFAYGSESGVTSNWKAWSLSVSTTMLSDNSLAWVHKTAAGNQGSWLQTAVSFGWSAEWYRELRWYAMRTDLIKNHARLASNLKYTAALFRVKPRSIKLGSVFESSHYGAWIERPPLVLPWPKYFN